MIFLGDIASPTKESTASLGKAISENNILFRGKRIICNLEGMISEEERITNNKPVLFNHPSVPVFLNQGLPPVFCLANNHVPDHANLFKGNIALFNRLGILNCGAGCSVAEANEPVIFNEGPLRIALFNSCWSFLLYNHRLPSSGVYISLIEEKRLLRSIAELMIREPDILIVVYLHWNLDLEVLPFPMHRQFARALIDAGAKLVVGSHSHCVQGGEKYRNGSIVYGLGNFFVPNNIFIDGNLRYPEFAKTELALEWDPVSNKTICHWFCYELSENGHRLEYKGNDLFDNSVRLASFSPYAGMSGKEYIRYFRKHRRKKTLVPAYNDYRKTHLNAVYTLILKTRAHIARQLAILKVINWNN